jgi:hypothetical protein
MLSIVTGLRDTEWLVYIMEEFSRINRTEFSIQVISPESSISSSNVIIYNENPLEGVCIPDRSYKQSDGKTRKISKDLFIIQGTEGDDNSFTCEYDLFWNAFVFLSRLEEYENEKKGRRIQSYSFKHPRKDKSTFDIPVVNNFFNRLEQIIKKNFPNLSFGEKQKPIIEYSHDVDYIQKTLQLRLKQTVFNGFNTFKSTLNPVSFARQVKKTLSFLMSNPSCWCFDYWEKIERKADIRSIFYVYAKTEKNNLKSWLLDPSYNITANVKFQEKLRDLIHGGFEVGLHGSFHSATDEKRLSREKEILEDAVGREVRKVRQHWLRYEELITPYIHDNLFRYDSTLGWNDRMGFRSGIAGRYRPYDHKNKKPFNYMVTPQVIMDANIYDYGAQYIDRMTEKAMDILTGLRRHKTPHISISWHQRVCNSDYGWHELYEQILIHQGHKGT